MTDERYIERKKEKFLIQNEVQCITTGKSPNYYK